MTKTELKKETFTKIERSFYKHRFLLDLPKREVDPGAALLRWHIG